MKDKVMDALQRFSKAMFIPVLILPIAGILIAVGNLFTNVRLQAVLPFLNNPVTIGFGTLLSGSLNAILGNLGVIFCVGLSVGLANKKKSEAGFISLLAFLVFLNAMNKFMNMRGMLVEGSLSGTGQAMVLGVQVLDMGVFIGLLLGIVVAYIHNRFCETEFNNAFQIYGGTRFVFIVLIPVMVVLAVLFTFVWPYAQAGINALGGFIRSAGNFGVVISMVLALFWPVVQTGINNFGIWIANSSETSPVLAPFIYGTLERLLIPTGLHHLVYTPFLYTSLGGTATVGGQVLEGARNIYYAEIADPSVAVLSQSVIWDARGISKMFGLIGACLAMYQTARPENREKIKPVLITAAVTSFIAGVTEPIEFSFLFVAPILFVVHAVLAGSSFVVLNLLGCRAIGPNGFIDFLLYNLPLGIGKTRWPIYIAVGVLYFVLYYVIFRVLIVKLNLHTLGREAEGMEMKLHSKSEYKAKVAAENGTAAAPAADNTVDAAVIVEALGGKDNILKVTNCPSAYRAGRSRQGPGRCAEKPDRCFCRDPQGQECPGGLRPEGQRCPQGSGR